MNLTNIPNKTIILKGSNGTPLDTLKFMHETILEKVNSPFVQKAIHEWGLKPDKDGVIKIFEKAFNSPFTADGDGIQDIRTPARLYKDGMGNCVDYTVFISTFLTALRIPNIIRMVSFTKPGEYSHVFSVIPTNFVLDAVYGQNEDGTEIYREERKPIINTTPDYKYSFDRIII